MIDEHLIDQNVAEHRAVVETILSDNRSAIASAASKIVESLRAGGCIFWFGNGGSASDSQHLAAEFVGRFKKNRRALRSIALNCDTSTLTCISNDFSFDDIFARQIEALGRPGDLAIGISTSGNSENVIRALNLAKEMGLTTISMLGKGGGKLREATDVTLLVRSDTTARVQETHILIGHIICDLVELELGFA